MLLIMYEMTSRHAAAAATVANIIPLRAHNTNKSQFNFSNWLTGWLQQQQQQQYAQFCANRKIIFLLYT